MATIKTVAVAGASGNIGSPLLHALKAANYIVTALTRPESTAIFPDHVKVVTVDYNSIASLTAALTGQDAVVSTVGSFSLSVQPNLVEAAAAAGVRRFIPAEYGADLLNPRSRAFPIVAQKIEVQELLERKAKEVGMTYTLLFTGLFLDWGLGLQTGMILDVKAHSGTLYDGGNTIVSTTRLATVGKGIVGCLEHEEETKNRGVYIQDIAISQNKILEIAKKLDPDAQWDLKHADTAEMEKTAAEAARRKDPDITSMFGSIFRMYFGGEEYGMPFKKLDNELLGIKGMSDSDLEELIKDISTGKD